MRFNITSNYIRLAGKTKTVYALRINDEGKITEYSLTGIQVKNLKKDIEAIKLPRPSKTFVADKTVDPQ